MALVCGLGRVLFGPAGDPLGLAEVTLKFADAQPPLLNGVVSFVAFLSVASVLHSLGDQRRRIRTLDAQVAMDPLTGVGNRRALSGLLERLARDGSAVSVLAADIDHFKRINDEHGHDAGDRVLCELARRLRGAVRGRDLVARTGGEEFVVVLPGVGADEAAAIAERIRVDVGTTPFEIGIGSRGVTVSVGCATGLAGEPLLTKADAALYAAKANGRDRVECAAA